MPAPPPDREGYPTSVEASWATCHLCKEKSLLQECTSQQPAPASYRKEQWDVLVQERLYLEIKVKPVLGMPQS